MLLVSLHPCQGEKIRDMAPTPSQWSDEDWKLMAQFAHVEGIIDVLGPKRVLEILGVEEVAKFLAAELVVAALGPERVLEAALRKLTPEQQRQLRERLPSEESKEKKEPDGTS
jgi:hypothetical protein